MPVSRNALLALFGIVAVGCGSAATSMFGGTDDGGVPDPGTTPGLPGDPNEAGTIPVDSGYECKNLCLQQKTCATGSTTVTGVVMDPAGKVPLYNVLVYVPNAPVAAITTGPTCDRCGSVSGEPIVSALSGVDGTFTLNNVPVGDNIPLVVQIGKWRRQYVIPNVAECTNTAVPSDKTRLPRSKSEGDLPQIALTTGSADVMECWLRKIGIADEEFTVGSGNGKVHLYQGSGDASSLPAGATPATSSFQGGAAFSSATDLWSSEDNLSKYDIAILSCEGSTFPETKPPAALTAMKSFADKGGRVFASHWHRYWFDTEAADKADPKRGAGSAPSPFESFATWQDGDNPTGAGYGFIDTSFPKGKAMHDWLGQPAVNGLCGAFDCESNPLNIGELQIDQPRINVTGVDTSKATSWMTLRGSSNHQYVSFNTPIPAADDQKCGRVVFSDLHVTTKDSAGMAWPTGCKTTDLTPQEKALEFMLFDLSSCIQSDKVPPAPPTPPVLK